jgi:predicted nucleic acid-binding protein
VTIFADTSALYATLDRDDQYHAAAAAAWAALVTADEALITSNYVLVETMALVQRRLGAQALQSCIDRMLPMLETEWVTEDDDRIGLTAVVAAARRQLSFVDCVSFRIMRRLRLRRVFAFDPHFTEQGFAVLPAS